jgi:2-keto-4-pentenoate hydratase/2-oxohepta-3-ene-1,7-dioic acid hydratase in catechol pathway
MSNGSVRNLWAERFGRPGTPAGVGIFREPKVPLRDGDVVEIEGIGVLRNDVRGE